MILDNDLHEDSEYQMLKEEQQQATSQIHYGFYVLIFLILQIIYTMITLNDNVANPKAFYVLTGSILVTYAACLGYALQKPKQGMMAALIAIIAMYILFSMVYPGNLFRGLLVKIVAMVILFKAHQAAERLEEIIFQIERLTERLKGDEGK